MNKLILLLLCWLAVDATLETAWGDVENGRLTRDLTVGASHDVQLKAGQYVQILSHSANRLVIMVQLVDGSSGVYQIDAAAVEIVEQETSASPSITPRIPSTAPPSASQAKGTNTSTNTSEDRSPPEDRIIYKSVDQPLSSTSLQWDKTSMNNTIDGDKQPIFSPDCEHVMYTIYDFRGEKRFPSSNVPDYAITNQPDNLGRTDVVPNTSPSQGLSGMDILHRETLPPESNNNVSTHDYPVQRVHNTFKQADQKYGSCEDLCVDNQVYGPFNFLDRNTCKFSSDSKSWVAAVSTFASDNCESVLINGEIFNSTGRVMKVMGSPDFSLVAYVSEKNFYGVGDKEQEDTLYINGVKTYSAYSIDEVIVPQKGMHWACTIRNDYKYDHESVVVDGQLQKEYDQVLDVQVGSEGNHCAYLAKRGETVFMVRDGVEREVGLNQYVSAIRLSPNGSHLAYILRDLSTHQQRVILDGKEAPLIVQGKTLSWDEFLASRGSSVGGFCFSPDSQHFVFSIKIDKSYVFVDGVQADNGEGVIEDFTYSKDSKNLEYTKLIESSGETINGYIHSTGLTNYLVVNGRSLAPLDSTSVGIQIGSGFIGSNFGGIEDVCISPDGRHVAYMAGAILKVDSTDVYKATLSGELRGFCWYNNYIIKYLVRPVTDDYLTHPIWKVCYRNIPDLEVNK